MRLQGGASYGLPWAVRHSGRGPLSRQVNDTLPLHECRLEHPLQLTSIAARCGTLSVPEDREHPQGGSHRPECGRGAGAQSAQHGGAAVSAGGRPGTKRGAVVRGAQPPHSRASTAITPSCCWISAAPGNPVPLSCDYPEDWQAARGSAAGAAQGDRRLPRTSWGSACASIPPAWPCAIWTTCARPWAIEQIDLYGGSYGTRVAELYMRRFPARTCTR